MKIVRFIENNVSLVLLLGVPLGLVFPFFAPLKWSLKYILMFVLFVSFIKIDFKEVFLYLKRPFLPLYVSGMNLFVAPLLVSLALSILTNDKSMISAMLLLSAVPSGVASTAMSDLMGADSSLTLIITIFSHFIAPFSIPFLFYVLMRKVVHLNYIGVSITMGELILIPLILAYIAKRFYGNSAFVRFLFRRNKSLTAVPISFISLIVISINASFIYAHPVEVLKYLAVAYAVYYFFIFFGLLEVPKMDGKRRMAISNSKTFMNVSIGIVLAIQFFDPKTALIITLSQIPWPTMFPQVNFVMKKLHLK